MTVLENTATKVAARWRAVERTAGITDKATLDRWKKDLRVMTKIYRDLDADAALRKTQDFGGDQDVSAYLDQLKEAKYLFRTFRDNFDDWVYKELLPKKTSDHPETPMQREIRKLAWDLHAAIDNGILFPDYSSSPDWGKIREYREGNVKRYQVAATKVFKEIEQYIDMYGGQVDRPDAVEHFAVGGAHVILENFGKTEHTVDKEPFLRRLGDMINQIKRAGFPGAVRGLTVTIDFNQKEWDTNAMYNPTTDKLSMFPLGLSGSNTEDIAGHGTFTHECGHRFYFKELPTEARNYWSEVMTSRGVQISKEDAHKFSELVVRHVDLDNLSKMIGDDDRLRVTLPQAKDESEVAKFRELAKIPLMPWTERTFDPQNYLRLLESKEGETVQIEEITDYGNTNPMEAFAEVFRLWVTKGPRAVGPWMREFFPRVCHAGGARMASTTMASEVVRRWLSLPA